MIAFRALAKLATPRPAAAAEARCELCAAPIPAQHRHVVELGVHGIQCACRACAILFAAGEPGARYRTVPERVLADPSFALTSQQWSALGVPVGLAFLFRDSVRGQGIVCYPGAAGVVEGELDPEVWDAVAAATPLARVLVEDVEALIVHGERGARELACYLVPISDAYELAGRLRASWQGFSGGDRARAELAAFFAGLAARAQGGRR